MPPMHLRMLQQFYNLLDPTIFLPLSLFILLFFRFVLLFLQNLLFLLLGGVASTFSPAGAAFLLETFTQRSHVFGISIHLFILIKVMGIFIVNTNSHTMLCKFSSCVMSTETLLPKAKIFQIFYKFRGTFDLSKFLNSNTKGKWWE